MNTKEAWALVGGLSKPSKMPGWSIGIPAAECKTGKKLQLIPDSVCYNCYALKGCYVFKVVQEAQYKRLKAIKHPDWVQAMALLINSKKADVFRWHDSGDLQSHDHLKNIFEVCKLTPETRHWLPTQERQYLPADPATVPDNLIIRLSGSKVDGPAPKAWPWTSSVVTTEDQRTCPAPTQSNECKDCRACWDRSTSDVAYGKH